MNRKNWQAYLDRQNPTYSTLLLPEHFKADLVVVIPCYNEPDLFTTLHSLEEAIPPNMRVATIIVFNSSERSTREGIQQNRISCKQTVEFAAIHNSDSSCFLPLLFEDLPRKHAGVGLARKIGMDLAVQHFFSTENERGVIVSLDADCTVSANFFADIYKTFMCNDKLNVTVHNFYHRVEGENLSLEMAVRQYEGYIRYFRDKLQYIGFPYYYHTIGSAFAVKADAYVRVGGMGRQQGGEDFYFLQKIFALGEIREHDNVWVYPLARFSDRVPFGTGPALEKILNEPDGQMKVYSPDAFEALKQLFELKDIFFGKNEVEVEQELLSLHPAVQMFLNENEFLIDVTDCNTNSASLTAFQKRFFQHFNAFKIIKYLNCVHPVPFPLIEIKP
jgi:glycosyltransferase involved in cell wall biosynthesis